MNEQTTIVDENEGRIHAIERTSQAQPVTIVPVTIVADDDDIVYEDGAFMVVKRPLAGVTPARIISALFAMAAVASASAPLMAEFAGSLRRRPRRASEEPYAGPKVEHVEAKGPRHLTRRERKASR